METTIDWKGKDAAGKTLNLKQRLMAIRLRKWQTRTRNSSSYESSIARAEQELERLKGLTGVPRPCVEQALEIYRQALKTKVASGWSPEAMAAAALYMACRMLKTPRPLRDFLKYSKADKSAVWRAAWRLGEAVRERPPLEEYVKAVAARAGLPAAYVRRALEILEGNRGAAAGRNPWILAAAALWLAVRKRGMLVRLAEAAGVTDMSVKNAVRRMKEGDAHKMAEEAVDRGGAVSSLRLTDVRRAEVDVGGRRHVVTVLGGEARFDKGKNGKPLLRIVIAAEVDGVRREYEVTFGRYGADNAVLGYAYAGADAERLAALIKALTGREPRMRRGRKALKCFRGHLEGLANYAELADAITKWLEETSKAPSP